MNDTQPHVVDALPVKSWAIHNDVRGALLLILNVSIPISDTIPKSTLDSLRSAMPKLHAALQQAVRSFLYEKSGDDSLLTESTQPLGTSEGTCNCSLMT